MLASRAGVVVLVVAVLAACVRNPWPESLPETPSEASLEASPAPERVRLEALSPRIVPQPWERYRAAERTVGAADRLAAPLPREWRGLRVAEPARCAAFEASDYAAGKFLPPRLPDPGGGFREPLGCSLFASAGDFAVGPGRVVSAEAAHDAGLCARPEARAAFGADPDNRLYLPAVLAAARAEAVARGDGDWLPGRNLCWYVGTQLRVRRRYGLSVSPWEARLFEAVLRGCPAVAPAPRCDVRGDGVW